MENKSEKQTHRPVNEIATDLRQGDHVLIADILECTSDYVGKVMREERYSERVLILAEELIKNREEFIEKHKAKKKHGVLQ